MILEKFAEFNPNLSIWEKKILTSLFINLQLTKEKNESFWFIYLLYFSKLDIFE